MPYDHTSEPWHWESGSVKAMKNGEQVDIAMAERDEPRTFPVERDENVYRIVLSVNACAGIPKDLLMSMNKHHATIAGVLLRMASIARERLDPADFNRMFEAPLFTGIGIELMDELDDDEYVTGL